MPFVQLKVFLDERLRGAGLDRVGDALRVHVLVGTLRIPRACHEVAPTVAWIQDDCSNSNNTVRVRRHRSTQQLGGAIPLPR